MFLQAIVAWDKQIYRLYHQHHPPRPAGRHLTDPLWYLRHGWWRWPLRPVLLKVEIELFHICVAKIVMATAHVHPFIQISFICTPKYAHWVRTASYLHPSRQCHAIQKLMNFTCTPIPPAQLHMYTHSWRFILTHLLQRTFRQRSYGMFIFRQWLHGISCSHIYKWQLVSSVKCLKVDTIDQVPED